MRVVSIWGREPAAWLTLAGVVVMICGRLLHWTTDQQGALNAVTAAVMAVILAVVVGTRGDGLLAVIVGLAKMILAGALAFHFNVTPDDQVLIMSVVAAVAGAFLRTQLTAPVSKVEVGAGP